MPKAPAAKPKRQRVTLDDVLWPLLVASCGGCVDPDHLPEHDDRPLHRGHIQSADVLDGPATLDNLQPVCEFCNSSRKSEDLVEDWRPYGWRDKFIKLVAQTLQTELIGVEGVNPTPKLEGGVLTLNANNTLENKEVISWANVDFRHNSALRKPLPDPPNPYPSDEYRVEVDALLGRGRKQGVYLRDASYRGKLAISVKQLGRRDFTVAADEFLRQWSAADEAARRRLDFVVFGENIRGYLADAQVRAEQTAAEKIAHDAAIEAYRRQYQTPVKTDEPVADSPKQHLQKRIAEMGLRCTGLGLAKLQGKSASRKAEVAEFLNEFRRIRAEANACDGADGFTVATIDARLSQWYAGLSDWVKARRLELEHSEE